MTMLVNGNACILIGNDYKVTMLVNDNACILRCNGYKVTMLIIMHVY